jgi:hypothetical protein
VRGIKNNSKFLKGLTILLIVLLSTAFARAQNVEAYAKLDTNAMMIGDHVSLELGLKIPDGFKVMWPQLIDTISKNIEIISKEPVDTTKSNGSLELRQLFTITSFDSGYFALPEFKFRYQNKNDSAKFTVGTNQLYLMVNTPVVDTSQAFKVIKGPVKEPVSFAEILPWALLGLFVVGIAIFLIWYIRKRRKNQPVFVKRPKPALPPDIMAIQKLEELRLAKIWQQGKLKEYFTDLTDIIREYLDGRFNIDAMEMTSYEIIDAIEEKRVNSDAIEKLTNVMQLADLVKFAKAQTTPLENDLSLSHCVDFVKETKPVVKVEKEIKIESDQAVVKEES